MTIQDLCKSCKELDEIVKSDRKRIEEVLASPNSLSLGEFEKEISEGFQLLVSHFKSCDCCGPHLAEWLFHEYDE